MELKELIEKIVDMEWSFFQKVQNEGGRADCQDDPWTFRVMRESQFKAWNRETLESYLKDLQTAEQEGRNPLSEKYAYMMKYTVPQEYARIEHLLPAISVEKQSLVKEIAGLHLSWRVELEKRYPRVSGKGRPLRSEEDTPYCTSFETYLAGELLTYSERTLELYLAYLRKLQKAGRNISLEILEYTVSCYGYRSLQEAENRQESTY